MTHRITVESLRLAGFRAYLREQTISLSRRSKPLSIAVFAPNAKGKSSLIDAFEFYFSSEATLSRLGIRAVDRFAGRAAIEHIDAQTKAISPMVELSFHEGTETFGESRPVTLTGTPLPSAVSRVLAKCTIPFLIRGYQLRGFVEDQTSEQRYEEIIAWFGLQPLLTVQKNLRALRKQVKQSAESTRERQERLRDLNKTTNRALQDWDEAAISKWLNEEVVAKLDNTLTLSQLSEEDKGYKELAARKKAEDESLGIATLQRLLTSLGAVFHEISDESAEQKGAILTFETAIASYDAAVTKEFDERTKASQTIFTDIWTAAKAIFENDTIPLETCPVCDTQFSNSPNGSRSAITVRLDAKLADLSSYRGAEMALKTQRDALPRAHRALLESLGALIPAIEDSGYAHKATKISSYEEQLKAWKLSHAAPDSKAALVEVTALHKEIEAEKSRIAEQQGEHTYAEALKTVESLVRLKADLERIERTKKELGNLNAHLNQQSEVINKTIAEHICRLIGALKGDINDLYKEIQGDGSNPPPVHLELPDEQDTNQQRIQLLIDFAEDRKGVNPTGYLSDSQIHALALSLRLSAIRTFNPLVPIIVLDDVVTSYDADHRKNIAAMLAKYLADYQIILVTHDERFFALLQDHLPPGTWSFKRITELKPDFGPLFHDHRTPDKAIQEKLDHGESCGNEIRQAEEEWLLDICRDFRTKVVIRPIERPYKYDRSELAGALAAFLKKAGITPPTVSGIANPFLTSLQKGDLENFASHFSDNPNETASIGDERTRWTEFKYFRDQFACPECGCKRFVRPEPLRVPVCSKCNIAFAFKAPRTGS